MFSIPSHVRFFHILFLPALTLQMKSLTSKGLTPSRTWVLHSCRTSVVWLAEGLDGWQTVCGKIWNALLGGKSRKELVMSLSLAWKLAGRVKSEGGRDERHPIWGGARFMCDALCESVHAWLPSGLSRASACAICCFHRRVPVALCSVFMCACTDRLLSSLVWICLWLLREESATDLLYARKHLHILLDLALLSL